MNVSQTSWALLLGDMRTSVSCNEAKFKSPPGASLITMYNTKTTLSLTGSELTNYNINN